MGYEAAVRKLHKEIEKKQQPFLDQRKAVLTKENNTVVTGTPALPGFWKTTLRNRPAFGYMIFEWDETVLDFLEDITKEDLKEEDDYVGFKLVFHFSDNPYFSNNTLWKEYHFAKGSSNIDDMDVEHIKASEINWKPGMDAAVLEFPVKAGNKSKQKEKSRPSMFRSFF